MYYVLSQWMHISVFTKLQRIQSLSSCKSSSSSSSPSSEACILPLFLLGRHQEHRLILSITNAHPVRVLRRTVLIPFGVLGPPRWRGPFLRHQKRRRGGIWGNLPIMGSRGHHTLQRDPGQTGRARAKNGFGTFLVRKSTYHGNKLFRVWDHS